MENKLDLTALDQWIDAHEAQMIEHICELVRIRSVSVYDEKNPIHPFGEGCAHVLDRALAICESLGFETRNYDYYGGTAVLPGETDETIGIFVHLDVVPEGSGWSFDPFQPFVKDGVLFGRGSLDNKGAAVASLYTVLALRELGCRLRHTLVLFFGCNEEAGMRDVKHFLACEKAPVFSYTADAGLPACNGEKGILEAELVRPVKSGNLLDICSGAASNMVPDRAYAVIDCAPDAARAALAGKPVTVEEQDGKTRVSAAGVGGHAAFPEKTDNAMVKLVRALDESGLLTGDGAEAVHFLAQAFGDYYGAGLNIDLRDEPSGCTTHIGGVLRLADGVLRQNINVRYAVTIDPADVETRIAGVCEANGWAFELVSNSPPNYMPADHPAIQIMTRMTNEVLGTDLAPFTMGGGTYAREIPNAVGFGPNRMDIRLPAGVGDGHQADEGIVLKYLLDGIRIYTRALIEIDKAV